MPHKNALKQGNTNKQLQPDSTSEEMLNLYLKIITDHPRYKLGTILPKFGEHNYYVMNMVKP
ncbi:hypothetical protein GCM10007414_04720 [Agarivorans gilvus]|uniref:Uncharacterized protein n=1 Tax=Agarivorans gilvus TaxID=680279 RepID=A0ABQ1HWM5_9ALTE|nr:hypothetical protein GCM10007414_04720 [Agarivorans gilvus]